MSEPQSGNAPKPYRAAYPVAYATPSFDPKKLNHRRPRVPGAYGFVHGIKRLIGIVLGFATLVLCAILAARWSRKAAYGGAGIAASIVLLCNDSAQCAAIFDASKKIRRAPSILTGCIDFLGLVACAVVAAMMGLSDWGYFENGPRPAPWEDTMYLCVAMLGANA
ncbi:hypothetical protein EDB81DRAFT_885792 [Dactylonectria macrodidyma]|uniref:Uncharacterized protein n=1 Tax=Dactylonectria macrodidyma TaxID=307937 RepID=A0A9P9EPS5_9HYPO|nr:hypothetical protein EDB81DRAFT_885792 [Dactylonectria macrodidyma]